MSLQQLPCTSLTVEEKVKGEFFTLAKGCDTYGDVLSGIYESLLCKNETFLSSISICTCEAFFSPLRASTWMLAVVTHDARVHFQALHSHIKAVLQCEKGEGDGVSERRQFTCILISEAVLWAVYLIFSLHSLKIHMQGESAPLWNNSNVTEGRFYCRAASTHYLLVWFIKYQKIVKNHSFINSFNKKLLPTHCGIIKGAQNPDFLFTMEKRTNPLNWETLFSYQNSHGLFY